MRRLGKVLHLSKSGKLILRSKAKVKPGTVALDENLKIVGIVFDDFGPVENPYVSVKPNIAEPKHYVGRVIYVEEDSRSRRKLDEYR